MPPKRKTPGTAAQPSSSKRVRIASGTPPPPTRTRSPGEETERQDENGDGEAGTRPPATAEAGSGRRAPGRPRRNTLEAPPQTPAAPSTPRAGGASSGRRKTPATTRKSRSAAAPAPEAAAPAENPPADTAAAAAAEAEGEGEDDAAAAALPLPLPPAAASDGGDAPSSDELSQSQSQRVNPTPKRRPKPRITYKSRRTSVGESDSDPLTRSSPHTTRSSPIKVAAKAVDLPTTPATTVKPRSKPPRARKKDAPRADALPAEEDGTPSAAVRAAARGGYGSVHETDAEGEDEDIAVEVEVVVEEEVDPDEDVVGGDGRIAAAPPATVQKDREREKASRRRSMPTPAKKTVELDGMEDPFAIDDDEPRKTPEKKQQQNGGGAAAKRFDQAAMKALKKHLLPKLMGRERVKLVGVEEEEAHVRNLLEQTVTAGEGNSMLIIGARGSGKTTLVESAIADLKLQRPHDFHTVRLTGFHQTDDRLALREILRQLGHEMALPAADTPKTSFADTLTTILAMLSHPDDLGATTPTSTSTSTPHASPAPPKTSLSVIFLLDEFDLFTTHPRQTLLYNLFDIAQSRSAPIAVIGTTTHLTITHSLEKRVKSRFSQRTLHLHPPATLSAFWERVRPSLAADTASTYNPPAVYKHWNTHLDALHATPAFQAHLRRAFARSASVRAFLNECILPVSALPTAATLPGAAAFAPALAEPDSILGVLSGLSDLELSLLIAAARLDVVSDTDTCNFSMAYSEYAGLVGGVKVAAAAAGVVAGRVWGREVARGAWERLAEYGLLTAVGKGGAGAEGMWRVEVGLGEIGGVVERGGAGGGRGGLGRWCREV
ncbi:uncharacterized protein H6S33_006897 [Morchella sextelata]|uniref:uncharacterized protein n=1 Tax=Morchella sextelata TaxID=1174677 RepID=UPI001D048E5F|nr:uncharacterized protein H6S33_006897 [Morchella sextelata]KAH0604520.1 hypothetical protein H6S33_006897 [Morchella sextelata]